MEGYGRSARPAQMDDKCNLSPKQQKSFGVSCPQTYPGTLTNIGSDWNDISAAVAYIQQAAPCAEDQPDRLVAGRPARRRLDGAIIPTRWRGWSLLAPAYSRNAKSRRAACPVPGAVFNTQSHGEFIANWDRQAPCPGQYDTAAADAVWSDMLKSDPVGASWTPAVRRAPIASSGSGWTQAKVQAMTTPILMVSGENDKQVNPRHGCATSMPTSAARRKSLSTWPARPTTPCGRRTICCCSQASLEWLDKGTVNGQSQAMLKLGYPAP